MKKSYMHMYMYNMYVYMPCTVSSFSPAHPV